MQITSVRCPILQTNVTRVTNLEGEIMQIICAEYDAATGICRVKKDAEAGGPLSRFLERVSEDALDSRTSRCALR